MEYSGAAFASSTLTGYDALQAFLPSEWRSFNGVFPQQVWFQFKHEFVLTKIGFHNRKCSSGCPTEIEIIAGNVCGATNVFQEPKVLLRTPVPYEDKAVRIPKAWVIPEENRAVYRCYGIKVLKAKETYPRTVDGGPQEDRNKSRP